MKALLLALSLLATPLMADDAANLRTALRLAAAQDWTAAQTTATGPIAQDIIAWQRLRAGEGRLGEYEAFLQRRATWPGLPRLHEAGEEAVARSTDPARVIAYFNGQPPETAEGALALIRAYLAAGRQAEAEAEATRAWVALEFDANDQTLLLDQFADVLKPAHEVRLDRMLWEGDREGEVARMLPLVSADMAKLAKARLALQAEAANASALVSALPQALTADPGLARDRFIWRMRNDLTDDALALILDRSASAASLGQPEGWAERRAVLARLLMRAGRSAEAYRVAANHHLTEGSGFVDLEFLAGFIALRHRDDPATALTHFMRLQSAVATPISLSRALYWQGRAAEAAGDDAAAETAYRAAARHMTAYYGQLAAERLGLPLDANLLSDARPPDWRQASFAGDSVLEAARLLLAAGDRTLAKRFILHLGESLNAQELDQLADMALSMDEPHIALLVAKAAAERGIILPRAYFPVPAMVPDGLPVSRALALSIARRESEFEPTVISPAGARGLMQVMPGTAELMADVTGLPFSVDRLTSDPAYNVAKGAAYLRVLIDEFGPSVAMIAAGYNAGPGRPRRWAT
ncbi:MAG: lytic transglycosylase domain-containing protein, partial [Rhodobacteraceae bacterium]|nr:lytic transglycosylase domain-containing protein [Paracoccaceae bacterium]